MAAATVYDVIVVGAGNAALCAAISASEQGAKVLVLEKAPETERGGNSLFTAGGFRFVHNGLADLRGDILQDLSEAEAAQIVLPPLSQQTFLDDLMRVTENNSDEQLAEMLVGRSRDTLRWMRQHKVRFIPMFGRQSYKVDGKHHFYGGVNIEAVGGGYGLVDQLLKAAERCGVEIRYDTALVRLLQDRRGVVVGVGAKGPDGFEDLHARAVVLACGGFEANPEMRTRYLGPGWELCRVRGTRHNTGDGIKAALEIGAQPFGGWSTCHAVAWDISAPPFGDRVVLDNFQKHSYPIGIVVNLRGERFVDEGADYRNHTYAKYGREIMKQPQRTAVQIFDAKTIGMVRDEYRIRQVTKAEADTIEDLAQKLGIDVEGLTRTVRAFNEACQPGDYNPSVLDGKGTKGIAPPKSNWALPIDAPPYSGFVVTCGITFTFGGLRINANGEVLDLVDRPIAGLYAAGELVGGIFYGNYLGGAGLMSGAVFGRLAGQSAGRHPKNA
ncbi:MAG: FAD-dependent tricarballylate dehydrogenase TcuA [Alphaproteobacteria bacterium]|nr:FAD-dependent tricarballylate dehydrogenase TcuA [Alphaproteobacteria bacterium]